MFILFIFFLCQITGAVILNYLYDYLIITAPKGRDGIRTHVSCTDNFFQGSRFRPLSYSYNCSCMMELVDMLVLEANDIHRILRVQVPLHLLGDDRY